jgi:hypothetical protein
MYCANSCWEGFACVDEGLLYPGVIGVCQPCQRCVFGATDALSGSCDQCRTYYEEFGADIEYLGNEGNYEDKTLSDTGNILSGSGSVDCNVCASNVLTSTTCYEFVAHEDELIDVDPM